MKLELNSGSLRARPQLEDAAWVIVRKPDYVCPVSICVGDFELSVTTEQARAIYHELKETFEEVKDV